MSGASRGRIAGLDLLRGVAIALVMLRHALPDVFAGAGLVGVLMFFTLSGHLITGVLLDGAARGAGLREFYARRVRRLVPALVLMLAGWTLVTATLDPLGERPTIVRSLLVALTWTADLPWGGTSGSTYHLWTLAVEEQFYLLWPLLLLAAIPRGRVGAALLLAASVSLAACLATVAWLAEEPDLAYALPTSWAGCLVVGAASRAYADRLRVPRAAVPVALAVLGVLAVVAWRGHVATYLLGGPLVAGLTAVLVLHARTLVTVRGRLATALVALGSISYAAYLWNYPLTLWLRPSLGVEVGGLVAAVLTIGVAWLSTTYVEEPLLRRRTPARVPS